MIDFINFNDRYKQLRTLLPHAKNVAEYLIAGLNIRIFEPASTVEDILIVYHGGGVNSDAGYDMLAHQISHHGAICTCLIDIRGHGRSLGNKGSVSNPEQVWRDIDTVLEHVRVKFPGQEFTCLAIQAEGMLINYFTRFTLSTK